MSKKKRAVQFSNNFFDEMQEKMQADDIKRRKLSKNTNSQPELMFLQFKPSGKEDFTSFTNKLYSQPSTSNTNKKSWKPPIKNFFDCVNTELSTVNKHAKEHVLEKDVHNKNKDNSAHCDNTIAKTNNYEETKSKKLIIDSYNNIASMSSSIHQKHPIEPIKETSTEQSKKLNSIDLQKLGFTESVFDFKNIGNSMICEELVKDTKTSSIPTNDEVRDVIENDSDPQQIIKVFSNISLDNPKQNLEIEACNSIYGGNILEGNLEKTNILKSTPEQQENLYLDDQPDMSCNISKLDFQNNSVDSDDELTLPNPWLSESNNCERGISNSKQSLENAETCSNSSSNEKLTKTDLTPRYFEAIAYISKANSNNYNRCDDQLNNQIVTEIKVELEKLATLKHFDCVHDKEDTYSKYNESSQENDADKVESSRINPILEKVNSCKEIVDENNKEIDNCNENLTQSKEICELFQKMRPALTTNFLVGKETNSNKFQHNVDCSNELIQNVIKNIEPDNTKNLDLSNIQENEKQCKDLEISIQANDELFENKPVESLPSNQDQSNNIAVSGQIKDGAATHNDRLTDNIDCVLKKLVSENTDGELQVGTSKNQWKYLQIDREETCSSQHSFSSSNSDLTDLTTEYHQGKALKIKETHDSKINNNQSKNTIQSNHDNKKEKSTEQGSNPQIENNVPDDEYSCLMISNSQLLEIEQQYYETPKITESEPLECKMQTTKTEYCRKKCTVGTQTDIQPVTAAQYNAVLHVSSAQVQWSKEMLEAKRKLRDTIEEVERLNSILLKVRKEIWPKEICHK